MTCQWVREVFRSFTDLVDLDLFRSSSCIDNSALISRERKNSSKMSLPSPKALFTSALVLATLASHVLARPAPEPKASWVRKGSGRKKMANNLKRAAEGSMRRQTSNATESCAETLATTITAPKTNLWAELSDVEAVSVVEWLFAQSELNLTTSDEAGPWDNTV
jgi:primary-amine oxidase